MASLQKELAPHKGKNISAKKEEEYYSAQREGQVLSKEIGHLTDEIVKANSKIRTPVSEIEERRAIKEANVTSLSYERSKRAIEKEVHDFMC